MGWRGCWHVIGADLRDLRRLCPGLLLGVLRLLLLSLQEAG